MTKLIKNWDELSQVPANDKYKIIVDRELLGGWIIPVWDEPCDKYDFKCHCEETEKMSVNEFFKHHVYLSTHTFYRHHHEYSTRVLQEHGFDVEIDNWDK